MLIWPHKKTTSRKARRKKRIVVKISVPYFLSIPIRSWFNDTNKLMSLEWYAYAPKQPESSQINAHGNAIKKKGTTMTKIYIYIQEITKKTHSRNPNAYELSKYTQNIRKKRTHKCIELFSPLSPINFQY